MLTLIGEYHGELEADQTGKVVSRWLQGAGSTTINYDYLIPQGVERLQGMDFGQQFFNPVELPTYTKTGKISKKIRVVQQKTSDYKGYIEGLKERLYETKPNAVVAFGANVLSTLCSVDSILNYRGSVLDSTLVPGLKVIPVVHPQWIFDKAQWQYYYLNSIDIKKAGYEATFQGIKRSEFQSIIAPSLGQCVEYLDRLSERRELFSFDIETRANSIACLGFCVGDTALCIPTQTTQGPAWSVDEEAVIWQAVGRVFASNPNLVGQNLTYDLDWMLDYGIEASGVALDTMIGQFILAPEMPKGLDYICSIYTDAVYYKDEGKTWSSKIPDEQLWKYNCKDTYYTLKAADEIYKTLQKQGVLALWEDYGRKLLPIALEIQKRGLEVDNLTKEELQRIIIEEYHRLRPEVVSAVGYEINVNSPKAVQAQLRDSLHLPLRKKRGKDSVTADEDALMGFLTKPLSKTAQKVVKPGYKEQLTLIMKERHLRKAGTYAGIKVASGGAYTPDVLFSDNDDVVRSQVNIAGTKTWRFSMQESPHGTGWNLQTAPKWARVIFPAPKGRVFLQPDQKQAEARVVAWYAKCKKQIELFNNPARSIHLEFGSKVFKRQLSKDTPEYTAAKSGVHGGNFRMQADKLAKTTGVDVDTCELAINGYHSLYPEIRLNYHNWAKAEVLSKGYLVNPFGLKRLFFHARGGVELTGKLSNDDWNDICSWLPQSTVPFITNMTLMHVCDILDYVWIHQQGHDAFLISVPEGREEECGQCILSEGNKINVNIRGNQLCIPWELTIGYNWGQMYERYGAYSRTDWSADVEDSKRKGKYGREEVIKSIYGIL